MTEEINKNYTEFYLQRKHNRLYPTEFVVRIFLANYPDLVFDKKAFSNSSILDIGFGDGRNTAFLCEQGFNVSGIEITEEIVKLAVDRLNELGLTADLRVGRNSQIPFDNSHFDYALACNACYYTDHSDSFEDNLKEISRVIKPGGWFVCSVINQDNYTVKEGVRMADGHTICVSDPYGTRVGYKLRAFESTEEIKGVFSPYFENFSFAISNNNYFGIDEKLFWVVCQKK
jgi:SAM-dependent methyltransferase